jgi:hypothetical protein
VSVVRCRRKLPDRRKTKLGLQVLKVILSKNGPDCVKTRKFHSE